MQTQEQLRIVSKLIRELDLLHHPDSSRIAKEVAEQNKFEPERINAVLLRLKDGEPWEYIRGYSTFMNRKFEVNKNVLIPRIETEQLVELTLNLQKKYKSRNVIDVGTGSGAIICSVAHSTDKSVVLTAIDLSTNALKVAKKNAQSLGVTKINFLKNFLLEDFELTSGTIIAANLPYISTEDYEQLPRSVKAFEPKLALHGGKLGTTLIVALLKQISQQKENIDAVILEMDPSSMNDMRLLSQKLFPKFTVKVSLDFMKSERFIVIER